MRKLLIFPTPLDARCQLQHDSGFSVDGVADKHPNGRAGQSFSIPDSTPNGWGTRIVISAPDKITLSLRGLLYEHGPAEYLFYADDFVLVDKPAVVVPPVVVPPITAKTPQEIINAVYLNGAYDLSTKEGCGKLVEDSVITLHKIHSPSWGHVKKSGAQNQYNGHAVDAIHLLNDALDGTKNGIYDIIYDSESLNAKLQFGRAGDAVPALWYY